MQFLTLSKKAYERGTGVRHSFDIYRVYEPHTAAAYIVKLDGEFYTTAESRANAIAEVEDVIKHHGWSHISPLCFA